VGLTFVEPLAEVDVKVPGVMVMVVAPLVAQLSLLLAPEFIVVGLAEKVEMAGTEPLTGGGLVEDILEQLASPKQTSRIKIGAQKLSFAGLSQR